MQFSHHPMLCSLPSSNSPFPSQLPYLNTEHDHRVLNIIFEWLLCVSPPGCLWKLTLPWLNSGHIYTDTVKTRGSVERLAVVVKENTWRNEYENTLYIMVDYCLVQPIDLLTFLNIFFFSAFLFFLAMMPPLSSSVLPWKVPFLTNWNFQVK